MQLKLNIGLLQDWQFTSKIVYLRFPLPRAECSMHGEKRKPISIAY
jgi:hypothetical protein